MTKRIKQVVVEGPENEVIKINWMPDNRLRLDFVSCGAAVVTKIFTKDTATHLELKYKQEAR